eukprot:TRINITY_DN3735_c0_g1_i1.p1 TRINITY_DN3735_c0_g1~~TRINITY_DN3735_c0_g1_i1.p1  ORF type:complete len:627 (+),score=128.65 TRINITY_DN3735_c0_g1_i1:85-1965(+)
MDQPQDLLISNQNQQWMGLPNDYRDYQNWATTITDEGTLYLDTAEPLNLIEADKSTKFCFSFTQLFHPTTGQKVFYNPNTLQITFHPDYPELKKKNQNNNNKSNVSDMRCKIFRPNSPQKRRAYHDDFPPIVATLIPQNNTNFMTGKIVVKSPANLVAPLYFHYEKIFENNLVHTTTIRTRQCFAFAKNPNKRDVAQTQCLDHIFICTKCENVKHHEKPSRIINFILRDAGIELVPTPFDEAHFNVTLRQQSNRDIFKDFMNMYRKCPNKSELKWLIKNKILDLFITADETGEKKLMASSGRWKDENAEHLNLAAPPGVGVLRLGTQSSGGALTFCLLGEDRKFRINKEFILLQEIVKSLKTISTDNRFIAEYVLRGGLYWPIAWLKTPPETPDAPEQPKKATGYTEWSSPEATPEYYSRLRLKLSNDDRPFALASGTETTDQVYPPFEDAFFHQSLSSSPLQPIANNGPDPNATFLVHEINWIEGEPVTFKDSHICGLAVMGLVSRRFDVGVTARQAFQIVKVRLEDILRSEVLEEEARNYRPALGEISIIARDLDLKVTIINNTENQNPPKYWIFPDSYRDPHRWVDEGWGLVHCSNPDRFMLYAHRDYILSHVFSPPYPTPSS